MCFVLAVVIVPRLPVAGLVMAFVACTSCPDDCVCGIVKYKCALTHMRYCSSRKAANHMVGICSAVAAGFHRHWSQLRRCSVGMGCRPCLCWCAMPVAATRSPGEVQTRRRPAFGTLTAPSRLDDLVVRCVHLLLLVATGCHQEVLLSGCPTGFASAMAHVNALAGAVEVVQRMVRHSCPC